MDKSKFAQIEVLRREVAYEGSCRVEALELRHPLHAGGMSNPRKHDVFVRGNGVAVIPYDPIQDRLVLLEQFRPGAFLAHEHPFVTEIIAGFIEEGENPEDVARRETWEETQLNVRDLIPAGSFLLSPGGCADKMHLFAAWIDAPSAGGIYGLAEEQEDLRIFTMDWSTIAKQLDNNHFNNALTILGLQWLALNRMRLRALWTPP